MNWPAIIKHSGDAELTYVSGESEWNSDPDLHAIDYDENDYLIDCSGYIFTPGGSGNSPSCPRPTGSSMALADILELVRQHAAQQGACCVAKLSAPTIDEAFKIVASLTEV